MINNAGMCEEYTKYIGNSRFVEFLMREFDKTAEYASYEELAEFAFGGMEDAIEAFEEFQGKSKNR